MRSKKIISGVAFCVHHNILVEYCYSVKDRLTVIRYHKPKGEYKTRIKNFVMIPARCLPMSVRKAMEKLKKVSMASDYIKWLTNKRKVAKAIEMWSKKNKLALLNKLNPRHTWNGENIGWR